MTESSIRSHLTPGQIRQVLGCFVQIRHILNCRVCLASFTEALLAHSEELLALLWKCQGLSTKTAKALARAGFLSWTDLRERKPELIPGIGKRGAAEIRQMLEQPSLLQ